MEQKMKQNSNINSHDLVSLGNSQASQLQNVKIKFFSEPTTPVQDSYLENAKASPNLSDLEKFPTTIGKSGDFQTSNQLSNSYHSLNSQSESQNWSMNSNPQISNQPVNVKKDYPSQHSELSTKDRILYALGRKPDIIYQSCKNS